MLVRLWNHARIRSWNQPVLSNKGKVSCLRKQRWTLWYRTLVLHITSQTCSPLCHAALEPMTSILRVRRAAHCATPPSNPWPQFYESDVQPTAPRRSFSMLFRRRSKYSTQLSTSFYAYQHKSLLRLFLSYIIALRLFFSLKLFEHFVYSDNICR